MKHLVAIVGGGIAGIAAAAALERAGARVLLVEAEPSLGGRNGSVLGAGWAADLGDPFLLSTDKAMTALCREAGLEGSLVALQGPVLRQGGDGARTPAALPANARAVALRGGMQGLFDAWARRVPVLAATRVSAVRWIADRRIFHLRDAAGGGTLREPRGRRPVEPSAVVLALPVGEARAIAEASRPLLPLAEALSPVRVEPGWSAAFVVPRAAPGWSVLELGDDARIAMEDAKSPGRAPADCSVVVVQGPGPTEEDAAREALWARAKQAIPGLDGAPLDSSLRWWPSWRVVGARPAIGAGGIPTDPAGLPLALAGGDTAEGGLEGAARSGLRAAASVLERLAER